LNKNLDWLCILKWCGALFFIRADLASKNVRGGESLLQSRKKIKERGSLNGRKTVVD
jgi:hypothetical protein